MCVGRSSIRTRDVVAIPGYSASDLGISPFVGIGRSEVGYCGTAGAKFKRAGSRMILSIAFLDV